MTTIQQQFDFISSLIESYIATEIVADDYSEFIVNNFECACAIQELLVDKMENKASILQHELEEAEFDLACAKDMITEEKRIAKLRERKTSKGMSISEFATWAKDRHITMKGVVLMHIEVIKNYFHGGYTLQGSYLGADFGSVRSYHHISLDDVWRIAD